MMEAGPRVEHAVILSLRLDTSSRERLDQLLSDLRNALDDVDEGECAGSDERDDFCLVYCYGTDAAEVYAAIAPAIERFEPLTGSWAIKRFGAAEDLAARRERVDL